MVVSSLAGMVKTRGPMAGKFNSIYMAEAACVAARLLQSLLIMLLRVEEGVS